MDKERIVYCSFCERIINGTFSISDEDFIRCGRCGNTMDQKRVNKDMELLRTQGKNPKLDKPKDWYGIDWDDIQKETDVLDGGSLSQKRRLKVQKRQINPKKIKTKTGGD